MKTFLFFLITILLLPGSVFSQQAQPQVNFTFKSPVPVDPKFGVVVIDDRNKNKTNNRAIEKDPGISERLYNIFKNYISAAGFPETKYFVTPRGSTNAAFLSNLKTKDNINVFALFIVFSHGWSTSLRNNYPYIGMNVFLYDANTGKTLVEGNFYGRKQEGLLLNSERFRSTTDELFGVFTDQLLNQYKTNAAKNPLTEPTPPESSDSFYTPQNAPGDSTAAFSSILIRSNLTNADFEIDSTPFSLSDKQGIFHITNILPGLHNIKVSSTGYSSFNDTVRVENNRITPLFVNLPLFDQTPPALSILSPGVSDSSGVIQKVTSPVLTIEGSVWDMSGIYMVAINGASVTDTTRVAQGDTLYFKKTIQLVNGKNAINIQAVDSNGFITEKSIEIESGNPPSTQVKRWAICIGINNYPMRPLKFASNDAIGISNVLKNSGDFNTLTFTDTNENNENRPFNDPMYPTKVNIVNKLSSLLQLSRDLKYTGENRISSNDIILFAFSGHGIKDDKGNSYLLPIDWNQSDPYNSAIADTAIINWLKALNIRKSIVMLDACRVFETNARTPLDNFSNLDDLNVDVMMIMYATKRGERSYEDPDMRHGVFSKYVIDGLSGEADNNKDNIINIMELNMYVYNKVLDWASNKRYNQSPYYQTVDNASGYFNLTRTSQTRQ